MGRPRLELHEILKEIMGPDNEVYYKAPPPSVVMRYPCVVYKRDYIDTEFAGDKPYRLTNRYLITVMERTADSEYADKIARLPMCVFNQQFFNDGIEHNAFRLYF